MFFKRRHSRAGRANDGKLANSPQSNYNRKLLPAQTGRGVGSSRRFRLRVPPLSQTSNRKETHMLVIHARRHIGAQEAMPS